MVTRTRRTLSGALGLLVANSLVIVQGCAGEDELPSTTELLALHSPLPDVPKDTTNRFADNPDAAMLGQRIFFAKEHSGPLEVNCVGTVGAEGQVSCATCHTPANFFFDIRGDRTSCGVARTEETNLPLVNSSYWDQDGAWTRDLHVDVGWGVIWGVVNDEEGSNPLRFIHLVVYGRFKSRYEATFGPLPAELDPAHADAASYPADASPDSADPAVTAAWNGMSEAAKGNVMTIMANSGKSVHAYLRRLVSRDAPFDRYVAGDANAMSASAVRGAGLFVGKANCADCHKGPRFSDGKYHNTGMNQEPDPVVGVPADDPGFVDGYPQALVHPLGSDSQFSDDRTTNRLTRWTDFKESDRLGAFRTPMLRNVALRGPFMHAGQLKTLRDVVKFYNDGGSDSGFPGTKSDKMKKLNLSDQEMDDLVAFMETLTGGAIPAELVSEPRD